MVRERNGKAYERKKFEEGTSRISRIRRELLRKTILVNKSMSLTMTKICANKSLIPVLAVVGNLLLYAVIYSTLTPFYLTNDDVSMSMISSGIGIGISDYAGQYLEFINVILSYILKLLYTIWPNVSWYGLFEIMCLIVSTSIITFSIASNRNALFATISTITFFILIPFFAVNLQFTIISAMLAIAGSAILMPSLPRWKYCVSAFFIIFINFSPKGNVYSNC